MLKPEIIQYGQKGLLLRWSDRIVDQIHESVLKYQNYIDNEFKNLIQETNIGYNSLLIILNDEQNILQLKTLIENINLNIALPIDKDKFLYTIPVCYDSSFGIDIDNLAEQKGITLKEVIELHTSQTYKIYFIGFLPGFLYLGGLDPILHTPRLSKPRIEIPMGSVAIGGEQTGIYPQKSPGGWHILGRTPVLLFDKFINTPVEFLPGDFIKFESISIEAFKTIEETIQSNQYTIKKETIND